MKLFYYLQLLTCWVGIRRTRAEDEVNFTCSLCPGGAQPATPDRVYQLGDSAPVSCGDIMTAAANANEDSCLGTVTWSNTFDWPSFCGCPDFKTQYICGDFCWDFKVAYAPLPSDIATNANCQDFAGYYPYLLDETQCGGDDLKVACCVNVEGSAAASKMNLRSGLLFQIVFVLARMVGALFLG